MSVAGACGLLLLVPLSGCGPGSDDPEVIGPGTDASALPADPRVARLLGDCPRSSYYDRFLDDIVPVLIEKLESAGGDPLKHAKEELGELGEPAAEALRRLVDRSFADAFQGPRLENAIDALSLNDSETAHDVLLRTLDHPMESVRQRAMRGLIARHPEAGDFDLFLDRVGGTEPVQLRRLYLSALFAVDPVRAERLAVGWVASGAYRPFWRDIGSHLRGSRDAEVGARCAQVLGELEDRMLALDLAAPAARFGDVEARVLLRSELNAEDSNSRIHAVQAVEAAGLYSELEPILREDPDETVRIFALSAIAGAESVELKTREEWVRPALDAESSVVRGKALEALCGIGDPVALDRALADLGENLRRLQTALLALRDPLKDGALSRRAMDALLERDRLEEHRSLTERGATFKAIGIVQLEDAARFLRETALAFPDEGIEGLRAHEWLMIQASNTGAAGRTYLWNQLAVETDPLRRIDLIAASCSTRDQAERAQIRERLLVRVEDAGGLVGERIFAADRAAKIGPAWIVAPRLRQVANGTKDARLQISLQCLLWRWY